MGEIIFPCSLCGIKLKAPASSAGGVATCPKCHAATRVPEAETSNPPPAPLPRTPIMPPPPGLILHEHEDAAPSEPAVATDAKLFGLNPAQVKALRIGACVLVALLLFPPWRAYATHGAQTHLVAAGHSPIWKSPSEDGLIDAYRLIAEGAAVIVLTAAGVLLLGWRSGSPGPGIVRRGVWWIRDRRNLMLSAMGMSLAIAAVAVYMAAENAKDARAARVRAELAERNQKAAELSRDAAMERADAAIRDARNAADAERERAREAERKAATAQSTANLAVYRAEQAKREASDEVWDRAAELLREKEQKAASDRETQATILDQWRKLRKGMTPTQVRAILGEPTSTDIGAGGETWHYSYPGVLAIGGQGRCSLWEPEKQGMLCLLTWFGPKWPK